MRTLTVALLILDLTIASSTVFAGEMIDFGAMWKAWGKEGQHAYFWGFIDGSTAVNLAALEEYVSLNKQVSGAQKDCGFIFDNTGKKTATLFDEYKLIDVMTNLYKDPANSYILLGDMVYIARDSLKGNDVTDALLKARKHAMATHELNEKMKGK